MAKNHPRTQTPKRHPRVKKRLDRRREEPADQEESSGVRLNKFIADCGVCSRRKADELIRTGQVMINGKRTFELGVKVDLSQDRILVNGKPVRKDEQMVYLAFHKPKNVVTTMNDPQGRPTVADYLKGSHKRLFPVGRLDWDSEGLILLTNDGQFSQEVSHPKEEIPKTYLVKVDGEPDDRRLGKLLSGVPILGGRAKALAIERIPRGNSTQYDWIKIVISEGRNRQIRYMFEKIGCDVIKLQRVAIGHLTIGRLKKGEFKILTPYDVEKIFLPMQFGKEVADSRR